MIGNFDRERRNAIRPRGRQQRGLKKQCASLSNPGYKGPERKQWRNAVGSMAERPGSGKGRKNERREIIIIISDSEDECGEEIIIISSDSETKAGDASEDHQNCDEGSRVEGLEAEESAGEEDESEYNYLESQEHWEDLDSGSDNGESETDRSWTYYSEKSDEVFYPPEEERIIWHQPERRVKRKRSEVSDGEESN